MKKIIRIMASALAVFVVVYSFYYMWKQSRPAAEVYELVTPCKRDIVNEVVATGTLEARNEVKLTPKVTGVIERLNVKAGDTVHMGDEIAIIRIIPDMTLLNDAQNRIETARIELEQTERDAQRSQALYEIGAISKAENEQMQTALARAKEALTAARSQVEVITRGVSQRSGSANTTIVRSTMSGTVLNVPVKVGSTVSGASLFSEGTTIAKVADLSDIVFNGEIDEIQVGKLHTGMTVTLVPGAMQNISIPAVLEYISPEGKLVNGTRKFEVKAAADIPAGISIRSGYSVNASIQLERAARAISVDEVCISFEDDQPYVYRLTSAADNVQDQKWERIPVTLGISDGLYIEVKSGITADMKLRGKKK